MERTQEEKLLGGFAHVAVLFSWLGLIYNLVIYFLYKPKSEYVTGHAKQGLGLVAISLISSYVLGPIFGASMYGSFMMGGLRGGFGLAVIGGLIMTAIGIAILVMVIMAAIKGFQGQEYKYPIIGEFMAKLNV